MSVKAAKAAETQAAEARPNLPEIYRRLGTPALRDALKKMHLIRRFEEGAEQAYMRGLIHGTMHLSIGQEASAVGICMPLTDKDYITSTHRGHGHCIAKGADIGRMFAEFFGKEDGYCHGRGGSMHIADPSKGNLGANGIVGGGIPIAVGAALSAKRRKTDRRGDLVLRRRRQQRGRLPRGAEHGLGVEAAGDLRVREQPLRHVDLDRALDRGAQRGGPRERLCDAGRHRRRQRFRCGRRGVLRGGRARPARRRARR